jgi:hypothetical protein
MSEAAGRAVLDAAYARLSENIEAKPITADALKRAAIDALTSAKQQIETDPAWLDGHLERLSGEQTQPLPPLPDEKP